MPQVSSRSAACGGQQHVVDADPPVLLEGPGLVVPEGVDPRPWSTARSASVRPRLTSRRKAARVGGRNSASFAQTAGVPAVLGLGDDVVVAEDHRRLLAVDQRRGPRLQPLHPRELVVVLRPRRRVAVRQVEPAYPDGLALAGHDQRLDPARLLVAVVAGQAAAHVLDRQPRQQRDAVEALLPVGLDAVAHLLDLEARELVVGGLDLLQHDDVGVGVAQPVEQRRQPRLDAVDVEGGDLHPRFHGHGRRASTLSIRRPSRSTTSKHQPSTVTYSPGVGRWPSFSMTRPASVA